METQKASLKKLALSNGLVLGLILVFIVVIMYITGMFNEGTQWPMYIYYLIYPFLIGYFVYSFRKKNDGYISLGEALKIGVTSAVIGGIIYVIYNIVFVTVIEPDFAEQMLDVAREKMYEQNPNMTEEQAEIALGFAEKFSNPYLGGAFWIIMSAFFGFIYSLISGLIFKNPRPEHI